MKNLIKEAESEKALLDFDPSLSLWTLDILCLYRVAMEIPWQMSQNLPRNIPKPLKFETIFPGSMLKLHDMSRDSCGDKLDKSATAS